MTITATDLPVLGATNRIALAPATRRLRGHRFIWLMTPPWDNVWTRQNHFTMRLSELGAEVLYVEAPFAISTLLRQGQIKKRLWQQTNQFRDVAPGLTVMRAPPFLPGGIHSRAIGAFNARIAARRVNQWLLRRKWGNYTCWCRVPMAVMALQLLKPSRIYYDVTDDYRHFLKSSTAIRELERREKILTQRATKIFYTAASLGSLENLKNKPAFLLPNGVDYELFAQAASPSLPVHPLLKSVKPPVIGYVGLTSIWTDFDLVAKLGRRFPGQVVMAGPVHPKVQAQARAIPGVIWTGFIQERAELPNLIKGFSVCIMPFAVNPLTQNMNPLKVWEYLATGKPFVSVDLDGLGPARSLIDVARGHEEFLQMVTLRLQGDEGAAQRQRLAKQYSWDSLFESLLDHLEI